MPLTTGTRLGSYVIEAPLGAGGMGEVYRARDTKLSRDVAIKVLSELSAADPDRLARFTREAQTLAALNHPNIAQIHGVEDSGEVRALVMELVDGPTLEELIAHSPGRGCSGIELKDVLPIARQIADALEAAHEQGIIHRDLKPANVKVRPDGTVKVLDFGLAKALGPEGAGATADAMHSPTLTVHGTQMGMIIGTAAYMAPEQAKGRPVDRRADIWAFGAVVFEMLTGRRAFEGDDVSEVLASVLKGDPEWSAVPEGTPASVHRLLRRCLEKDPRKRLSAIGDARLELDEIERPIAASVPAAAVARPSIAARLWPAAAAVVFTAGVAALLWPSSRPAASPDTVRLSVLPPPGATLYPDSAEVAISPDGRMVAFVVGNAARGEATQLWVRSLDSMVARRLESADGAGLPFWSPDSRRIGFFTVDKLKTVAAAGGRADVVCNTAFGRGATWNGSGVIVFAPDASGTLYRVSANGGEPAPVTTLDAGRKESAHRFPAFLPDGDHFLFAALPGRAGKFDIFAGSLRDGSRTLIGSMESAPVYAEPGWLLHARQGVVAAQPFDAGTLRITGEAMLLEDEPTHILDPATSFTASHAASVSTSGSLAYFSTPAVNTTATWMDATGRITGALRLPAGQYSGVRVSPDGTRAVFVRSTSPTESSLWLVDLARGGAAPLSSGRGRNESPVWSPDGSRVVFASDRDGAQDFFVKTVADASPEQPQYRSGVLFKSPDGWSPDGKWIIFRQLDPETAQNIWLLPTSGERTPTPYVRGAARDLGGWPSPDGHWLAYLSEDTGRMELYLQSFPEPGHKVQVSAEGARSAWWTPDGRRLLFANGDSSSLWQVDVGSAATLRVGSPKVIATLPERIAGMDAMPNRQRFLALLPERTGTGSVTIVQNWQAALGKKR